MKYFFDDLEKVDQCHFQGKWFFQGVGYFLGQYFFQGAYKCAAVTIALSRLFTQL